MSGPWERYQQGAQPQAPVIAPPDPYKQANEQRAQVDQQLQVTAATQAAEEHEWQRAAAQRAAREDAVNAQEDAAKLGKVADARGSAIDGLRNVIDKIDEVAFDSADNGGWFETGLTGSMTRGVPGTPAFDLAGNVKTIDANAAFNALAEMRQNSPTGGALGNVTEKELDLLKSSVANLDTAQSQGQFFSNLAEAKRNYLNMLARIDPALAEEYRNKPGIQWEEDGSAVLYSAPNDTRDPVNAPFLNAPDGGDGGNGGPPPSSGFFTGDYSPRGIGRGIAQGFGSLAEGVGDFLGLAVNPMGQALYSAAGYDQTFDSGNNVREALGLPANQNSTADTMVRTGTAALTGSLAARGIATVLNPGTAQSVMNVLGQTPIRDGMAGAAAGLGMEAGRASGIPGGELAGAIVGGVAGYGGANALAGRLIGTTPTNALAQAAQRMDVPLLPADVGGPAVGALTTGTRASPLSVAPVVQAAQRQQSRMGQATRRTAESQGEIGTTEQVGQGIRAAAQRFTKTTSERASRLYERAGEAARGVKIKPLQTLARLDEHIARVRNDPAAPESAVAELTRFRENIANGVNVAGLRDARTRLSQGVYDGNLRSGSDQAMWKDILAKLSDDIDRGLVEAGRGEAAGMFRRADTFWKGRVEHIDQVLQPILGRDKSGEQIVQTIESMARGQQGGNARLSRLLGEMTPQEAGQTRALVIDRLGRATPGAQDAEGTRFAAATFLTNWNKMTPQAKASLFNDTKLREDLNALAKLAEGQKTGQSMANHSNTGIAVGSNAAAGTALFLAHPVLALVGGGAQYLTGRLMASPAFARALVRTSKLPAEAAGRRLSEEVGVIAASEPLLAGDARALQQFLGEAFAQSPGRLAARENEDN
jgi:hypothetical protein